MRGRLRSRRLLAIGVISLAGAAVAAGLLLASPDSADTAGAEGTPAAERRAAPELEGEVLVPPPVTLARLRGKPVVINFWASWHRTSLASIGR